MNLSPPTIVSLILAVFAVISTFVAIPLISAHALAGLNAQAKAVSGLVVKDESCTELNQGETSGLGPGSAAGRNRPR